MSQHQTTDDGDLLWGVPAIAAHIKRPIRQTRYLITIGAFPVKRLGKRIIVGSKREIGQAVGSAPERARSNREDA